MTVPATPRRSQVYVGNGVATDYAFGFSTNADIEIVVTTSDEDNLNVTVLTPGTDYTVTLNPDQESGPGGVVHYASLPVGHRLVITSDVEASQPTQITNLGAFHAHVLEGAIDRQAVLIQQLKEQVDRAVKVVVTDDTDPSAFLQDAIETTATNAQTAVNAAQAAGISEGNALTSEQNAAASEGNALTSEQNAAASEGNALTSEQNAAASEQNAATSESNALTSEQNAAASEGNALTSEQNAATSESNAAISLEDFEKMYLGPKAADPAVDNQGGALIEGAMYWNTAADDLRVWDGSAWVVASAAGALPRNGTLPMTGQLLTPNGSVSEPAYSFSSATDTGMFRGGGGLLFSVVGVSKMYITPTSFQPYVPIRGAGGTAPAPAYSFTGDSDTGMYLAGTNHIGLSVGGADAFQVSATGSSFQVGGVTKMAVTDVAINGTVPLRAPDGSAGTPAYSFTGDTDTGMFNGASNVLNLVAGGVSRLGVTANSIQTSVPIRTAASALSAPAYSFADDTDTGIMLGAVALMDFAVGGVRTARMSPTDLRPGSDNAISLGVSGARWSTVYAATGTINTSDAREKTEVAPMTVVEIAAARDLGREIGIYQWLESVEKKGEDARTHVGLTVQRAIEVMESHGLDPFAYAFICHDEWEASEDTDAGDRYSFRYDQLNLFIARGLEARITALEDQL